MSRLTILSLAAAAIWRPAPAQYVDALDGYIGSPDSLVQHDFGSPDEVAYLDEKEALVWTYFLPTQRGDVRPGHRAADSLSIDALSLLPIEDGRAGSGYRQFAFGL